MCWRLSDVRATREDKDATRGNRQDRRPEPEVGGASWPGHSDSGWVRSLVYRNAGNPDEFYLIAEFESEEKARQNEQRAQHNAVMQEMGELFDGQPEFVDLEPVMEQKR